MHQLLRCASGHTWKPGSSVDCPRCGLGSIAVRLDATLDMPAPTPRPVVDSEVMGGLPAPVLPSRPDDDLEPMPPGTVASIKALSIPGYELIREIGRGGMGVVYQALQLKLNRTVAVKMILSGSHAGPGDLDRFRREAEAVAALSHPNIVRIFEIGETDGQPWLAFEYLEGGTLAHFIGDQSWPTREAAELCEQLARGVQAAHDRGIIHRDLKPGNILFASSGKIIRSTLPPKDSRTGEFLLRISDFGLAKRLDPDSFSDLDRRATGSPLSPPVSPITTGPQTRTGAIIGTPSYISPEQAAGRVRDLGPPADIYAIGAILYELLTGRPPFEGETPMDIVLKVIGEDPIPPSQVVGGVPRDLETICLKCLAKQPSKRYSSAHAVADDLRRWLDHQPIAARPVGRVERTAKLVRRHPAASATVVAGMLSLVLVAAVSLYFVVALRGEAGKLRAQQKVSEERRVESEKSRMEAERSAIVARDKMLEAEESRRGLERGSYALLMAQVSALAERDPSRARDLMAQSRGQANLQDFCWKYLFRSTQREKQSVADPAQRRIYAISWSADGRYVAVGGAGDTVRILDPGSLRELVLLAGHARDVYCLSFSPDGNTLATGDGQDAVRLWDLPENLLARGPTPVTIKETRRLDGHRGIVRSLSWSSGGSRLASGGDDGFVRVWQISPSFRTAGILAGGGSEPLHRRATRNLPVRLLTESRVSTRAVWAVSFAREGFRLAVGGEDGVLRFWDLDQGKVGLRVVQSGGGAIRTLAWSPLEDVLAVVRISSREEDHSIRLIRPLGTTGEVRETARLRGHTGDIYALAFSGDGAFLASGSSDRTIRVWDVDTRLERLTLRGHTDSVLALAFSPDEQRLLVSAGADFRTRVWETSPQRDPSIDNEIRDPVALATLSSDGRFLAMANARGAVILLRPQSSPRLRERMPNLLPLHTVKGEVTKLLFAPDEKTLYAVSGTKVVSWDLSRAVPRERPESLEMPKAIRGAGVCADGRKLWLCGDFGFSVRDAKTLLPVGDFVVSTPVTSFAVSSDETLLAVGTGNLLRLYDLGTGQIRVPTYVLTSEVLRLMAFVPKSADASAGESRARLVTTGDTGVVEVYDIASAGDKAHPEYLKVLQIARSSGHAEPVLSMSFSADGRTLATAGLDRTIKLRDPLTVQERMTLNGHGDAVLCAGFVRTDSALVSLSRDGVIRIWRGDPPAKGE